MLYMKMKIYSKQSLFLYTNNLTTTFGESSYFLSNHINLHIKSAETISQKKKKKKEKKHFQDKSEIEDKNVEERKCSSPDTGILSDKKRGSESLYTVDKLAVPSGTDT